jgi:hypothetical protein
MAMTMTTTTYRARWRKSSISLQDPVANDDIGVV